MLNEPLISQDLIDAQIKKHDKSDTPDALEYGLVIYTDGGADKIIANNSPVYVAGYGIHGYIYANTPTKVGAGVTGYTVTDYGYALNSRVTQNIPKSNIYRVDQLEQAQGLSQVQPLAYIDGVGGLFEATNNVGEATSFLRSLDIVERAYHQLGIKRVHFCADSEYVINNVMMRFTYLQNGWKLKSGKPVANQELFAEITARLEELSTLPIEWSIQWVKGHSDDYGNIQADKHASAGLIAAKNGHYFDHLKTSPAQGHWNTSNANEMKNDPSQYFLVDNKWYYDSQMEHERRVDGLLPLFLGNHDEDHRAGQPDGDSTYCVALMKEVPPLFGSMIETARRLDYIENGLETHGVFYGNMNNLLRPDFQEQLKEFEDRFLVINTHSKQVSSFDKRDLITRLSPAYISNLKIEKFQILHDVIDRVVDNKLFKHEALTDITDQIYDVSVDAKGKTVVKLKIDNDPSIKVSAKVIKYNADYVYEECMSDATLTYGITAPRRRVLSGIKDHSPKVYILTSFEAFAGFRYYTVISLPNGEHGIWTNPAANLRVF